MVQFSQYSDFFYQATTHYPYPYQIELGHRSRWPDVIHVQTGMGKTAAVILGWLWRRRFTADPDIRNQTPRRLVYCLPVRVLVEQTVASAREWITRTGIPLGFDSDDGIGITVLMGGRNTAHRNHFQDWDSFPEKDQILIGTQDQLLSRALNRGYAMSRSRWPMHFALLNNDVLWVIDEIQLMNAGLPTSAQLSAFRDSFRTFGPAQTTWMSATVDHGNLQTIDHPEPDSDTSTLQLMQTDRDCPEIQKRLHAPKKLIQAEVNLSRDSSKNYARSLAEYIAELRKTAETGLILVVVNQVRRSQEIYRQLKKMLKGSDAPDLVLIHSRFRPMDRKNLEAIFRADMPATGRIIIATQTIEAGVDIDAIRLVTELAPWPSLVQRFGRCNRNGDYADDQAEIHWIDIDSDSKDISPYTASELDEARTRLLAIENASPDIVSQIDSPSDKTVYHVIRRREIEELFDTTPDMTGSDLDISRYIREADSLDLQVYWRTWEMDSKSQSPPPDDLRPADQRELCPVSAARFRKCFDSRQKGSQNRLSAWIRDAIDEDWTPLEASAIRPGITILMHSGSGGYSTDLGWDETGTDPVPTSDDDDGPADWKQDDTLSSVGVWQTIGQHTQSVLNQYRLVRDHLFNGTSGIPWNDLESAICWHDIGKSHPVFQHRITKEHAPPDPAALWAKSPDPVLKTPGSAKTQATHGQEPNGARHDSDGSHPEPSGNPDEKPDNSIARKHFRHELASALAAIQHQQSDLIAYLAAAHHGKVRMSIRSIPTEKRPVSSKRYARGIWEGDILPAIDMGAGWILPETRLTLELMELGLTASGPSWLERTIALRNHWGPFRLAFLEMLIRVADWRGSREGDRHE